MVPGLGKQMQGVDVDDRAARLGPGDRPLDDAGRAARPELIKGSRRARIARGSGTSVQQVNQLLNGAKQMEKMMKQMGRGKTPNIQSMVAQMRR